MQAQHTSTYMTPFELVYYGCFPSVPINLVSWPNSMNTTYHEQWEVEKATNFKDRVCDIQKQA